MKLFLIYCVIFIFRYFCFKVLIIFRYMGEWGGCDHLRKFINIFI